MVAHAQSALIYGYNFDNHHLVSFRANAPSVLLTDIPLIGRGTQEYLIGLDIRPATGELYALGIENTTMRVVRVNTVTGELTSANSNNVIPLASATYYGMSFNPVVDRLRLVSDTGFNLRINPNDGTLTAADTGVAYAPGDVNVGKLPKVVHIAHSNHYVGATSTTLYGIDTKTAALVRIGGVDGNPSANGGELSTIGVLGISPSSFGGFDIQSGTNTAYAALYIGNASVLHAINLITGAATAIGPIGSNTAIDGLAIAPTPNQCLDLDGDGVVSPLTDGLMLSRALFGMTDSTVTGNALPTPLPPRATWSAIQSHMNSNCGTTFGVATSPSTPNQCLDVDGDGVIRPLSDGLMLLRALLGLTGTAVTNHALPSPLPPRATWSAIQAHMNSNCGMTFSP